MNKEMVNRVVAHIEDVIKEQKAASLHLDWFGGEPLMYFDEVIVPVSACANEFVAENKVKFSQHITTNATLLNADRIRQMKELHFTSFQIPIDGNEQRHNKIKYFSDKQGTYRLVIENINRIANIIPDVWIILRINYDKQTLKHIKDIVKDIAEESKRHIQVDFQRVWQVKCTDEERNLLKEAKEIFYSNGLDSSFWAYKPCVFRRCYADNYYHYAINYNGKIFNTTHNYSDDKVIGNLLSNGKVDWNYELLSVLFSKPSFENNRCLECKKLPVCMSPCI